VCYLARGSRDGEAAEQVENMFTYITYDPEILNGKPHVRGTRLSVAFILELFASGATRDEIINSYPQLTQQTIQEALKYAAKSVRNETLLDGTVR
jgi:uncharacterized protein (DUF433 family)